MKSVKIILVRPRNPLNIGAAARAMANFGFSELAVVDPYGPVWENARSAIGAGDIIKNALIAKDVGEAVADCHYVLATTAGQRRTPERFVVLLPDLRAFALEQASGENFKLGILFGSEKTGLTNKHISFSHMLLNIPTSENQPSMNLGQSVAVVCYELSKFAGKITPLKGTTALPASVEEINRLTMEINEIFKSAASGTDPREEMRIQRIRKVLFDLHLSQESFCNVQSLVSRVVNKVRAASK
ncbi:MAG: RNA methyltransferase [Elusimicrobiaceae bacterium]